MCVCVRERVIASVLVRVVVVVTVGRRVGGWLREREKTIRTFIEYNI